MSKRSLFSIVLVLCLALSISGCTVKPREPEPKEIPDVTAAPIETAEPVNTPEPVEVSAAPEPTPVPTLEPAITPPAQSAPDASGTNIELVPIQPATGADIG